MKKPRKKAPTSISSKIPNRPRLVPRGHEDRFVITKTGRRKRKWSDLYVHLLSASWKRLFLLFVFSFVCINSFFAVIYFFLADGIENVHPNSFWSVFFFSVQTLSTIGYGKMVPVSFAANFVVSLEAMAGILFTAVVTGLVFSKFSLPTARVIFSNVAVINNYQDVPHLMLRLANERDNRIVDARIQVSLLRRETSSEGHIMRRFYDLSLVREQIPMLQLTWTVMHALDENSPLYQVDTRTLKEWDAEIVVSLAGVDETFSQIIHARHSYIAEDILYDASFVDIVQRQANNSGIDVDLSRIHDVKGSELS